MEEPNASTTEQVLTLTEKVVIEYGLIGMVMIIMILLALALVIYVWRKKPDGSETAEINFRTQLLNHASINAETNTSVKHLLGRMTEFVGLITQNIGIQISLIKETKDQDQINAEQMMKQMQLINTAIVGLLEQMTKLEQSASSREEIYQVILEIKKAMVVIAPVPQIEEIDL